VVAVAVDIMVAVAELVDLELEPNFQSMLDQIQLLLVLERLKLPDLDIQVELQEILQYFQ